MTLVVLRTDVHSRRRQKKIEKFLKKLRGVEHAWASVETNEVMVQGLVNAEELMNQLNANLRKPVTIASHGVDEDVLAQVPAPRSPTPPASPYHYRPLTYPTNYPPPIYHGYYNHYPYGPDESLALFSDENPNACSVQ